MYTTECCVKLYESNLVNKEVCMHACVFVCVCVLVIACRTISDTYITSATTPVIDLVFKQMIGALHNTISKKCIYEMIKLRIYITIIKAWFDSSWGRNFQQVYRIAVRNLGSYLFVAIIPSRKQTTAGRLDLLTTRHP